MELWEAERREEITLLIESFIHWFNIITAIHAGRSRFNYLTEMLN